MKIYNLEKSFENFKLSIEYMDIPTGKIYGIIGPNGCGKSTLVKILSGTLKQDKGRVDYENISNKDITMIPRKPYMISDSIYNNLIYPLKLRNINIEKEVLEEYIKMAGFENNTEKYAPGLSGGQMQKLALIRSMIYSPSITIVDEGFSNLDIESTFLFEEEILKRQKNNSSTWIIVSHQISTISRLCDHIFFMWEGSLILEGSKDELLYNPKSEKLKKYLQTVSLK